MEEKNKNTEAYQTAKQDWWQGRYDGDKTEQLRWWQHIQLKSLLEKLPAFKNDPVIVGFASDEGVARNKGRVGSADGPQNIRKALFNLPIHHPENMLYDLGNIHCINQNLEAAQAQLADAVAAILEQNGFPILLGGGHEILYGHYAGTSKHFKNKKVGIINFDPHFDLRKPENGKLSSGTGFYQVATDCRKAGKDFLYLALGIQRSGNTSELFNRAADLNVEYMLAHDFHALNIENIKEKVNSFLDKTNHICLTLDLDVFSASITPGVSAPSAAGILYDHTFKEIIKLLAKSGKVVSLDIAEYNPKFDIDSLTARLAAQFIFDWEYWRVN